MNYRLDTVKIENFYISNNTISKYKKLMSDQKKKIAIHLTYLTFK